MGAIQSAINQGLATAGILYSQSDLADQRKKDFADKREIKDIDKQLNELSGAKEKTDKELEEFSKKVDETGPNGNYDELGESLEIMQSGMNLYQNMATDLSKRKFELTKDPGDLKSAQLKAADKKISQNRYDEIKALIAKTRTLQQQKVAESIKPRNFYKELREMETNDKQ